MTYKEKLAKIIKNQSELSRKTGLKQSAISEWLRTDRKPFFHQVVEMAHELKVSLDWLADDAQDEPPVPEFTEDERCIIKVARDLKLSRPRVIEALHLAAMPVRPIGRDYGDMKRGMSKKPKKAKKDGT